MPKPFRILQFILFFYVIIAVSSRFTHPKRELFPFFAFTLFTKTPDLKKVLHVNLFLENGIEKVKFSQHPCYKKVQGGILRPLLQDWHKGSSPLKKSTFLREIRSVVCFDNVKSFRIEFLDLGTGFEQPLTNCIPCK